MNFFKKPYLTTLFIFAILLFGCTRQSEEKKLKNLVYDIRLNYKKMDFSGLDNNSRNIRIDSMLNDLGADSISMNSLSDLKLIYWELYIEPLLDDEITDGIDRIIKNKIDKAVTLRIKDRKYPPFEAYVITEYNKSTFQGKLENTYADDSIHIPEFPENYDFKPVKCKDSDLLLIDLNSNFRFEVTPRIYQGHSWKVRNAADWKINRFKLPPGLTDAVLFAIVAEKYSSKRKYKVLWVIDNAG